MRLRTKVGPVHFTEQIHWRDARSESISKVASQKESVSSSEADCKYKMNSSSSAKTITPLPFGQISTVFAIQFSEAMNINVLFPFLAFMVEDFGYGGPELGYYAGGLAAAFCGAQFLSAVFWGMISDKYGRRPAVILGTFGTAIGMLVFGLSRSYTQALVGRFLSGLLAGNIGVLKSFLTEISDESNRGKAFAMLSMAWATGTIVAPLVGGLLSKPADKYSVLNIKLFQEFPYLLPCLICVTCNLNASLVSCFVMRETRKATPISLKANADRNSNSNSSTKYSMVLDSSVHRGSIEEEDEEPHGKVMAGLPSRTVYSPIQLGHSASEIEMTEATVAAAAAGVSVSQNSCSSDAMEGVARYIVCSLCSQRLEENLYDDYQLKKSIGSQQCRKCVESLDNSFDTITFEEPDQGKGNDGEEDAESDDNDEHIISCCYTAKTTETSGAKNVPLFFRRRVVIATGAYGLLCMSYILLDETIPLFLKLDKAFGGLSFGSSDIGFLLSLSGVFMVFFTSIALPLLASMKKSRLFLISTCFAIPVVFAWPSIAVLNRTVLDKWGLHGDRLLWLLLGSCATLKNIFACCAFTAVMIQVNDSCSHKHLGAVNGLGQSLGALARAVGPAIGGLLWSISLHTNFIFTNFLGCAVLLVICQCLNYQLPDPTNNRNGEENEEIVFNEC